MTYKILVVEDSKTQALHLQLILEDHGYDVDTIETGREAIEYIASTPPDLILLDNRLPDMHGFQLCRQIRIMISLRALPIIILTEDESEESALGGLESGADFYLSKSISSDVLVAKMKSLLKDSVRVESTNLNQQSSNFGRWKLLLVDDSPSYCELAKTALIDGGFVVEVANSAAEGLQKLKTETYNIVLVDYLMPDMDGIDLLKHVFQEIDGILESTSFALLTGIEDEARIIEGFEVGVDDFIFKSSSTNLISRRAQALVKRKEIAAENQNLSSQIVQNEIEKKIAKSQAESAQKVSDFKSSFLASMSHEIRTPLNAILGIAEVLRGNLKSEENIESISIIQRSGDALLELINDILDISKIESGQLKLENVVFHLVEIVEGIIEMMKVKAQEKGLKLYLELGEDVQSNYMGDPAKIRQITVNLISNALKFTETGSVTVKVSKSTENPEHTLISVIDTGIGIKEENIGLLFQSFTQADTSITRKFGGTGLGLAITKTLTELMGGHVTVTSEYTKGSQFQISLPLKIAESDSLDVYKEHALSNKSILIVSHSGEEILHLTEILESYNMKLISVSTPEEATDLIKSHAADYHAILMDTDFPNSFAYKLLEVIKFKKSTMDKIILMLPNSLNREDMLKTEGTGVESYLIKPMTKNRLVTAIYNRISQVTQKAIDNKKELDDTRPLRILIAEDGPENRLVVKAFLKKTNYKLTFVENGLDALNSYKKHEYDLVLMDIQMPVMDGHTATIEIRRWEAEQQKDPKPILALSAHAFKEEVEKSLAAGCESHLSKPIRKPDLLKAIRHFTSNMPDQEES